MIEAEGVIKFESRHRRVALDRDRYWPRASELIAWRELLSKTELVGRDGQRYQGAAYGNVSCRVGAPSSARGRREMLISGTQTGDRTPMTLDDFCVVSNYAINLNRVESSGLIEPSSEAMTHAAIYDLSPSIRCVLHVHSPQIWSRARLLRLPTTSSEIAYGTKAMAEAVAELYRRTALAETRVMAMGGHEDGIIAFGRSVAEAAVTLLTTLAAAHNSALD